jgi:hypothetical protein
MKLPRRYLDEKEPTLKNFSDGRKNPGGSTRGTVVRPGAADAGWGIGRDQWRDPRPIPSARPNRAAVEGEVNPLGWEGTTIGRLCTPPSPPPRGRNWVAGPAFRRSGPGRVEAE